MTNYKRTERTLILRDCDGDDPTCEDVYGFIQSDDSNENASIERKDLEKLDLQQNLVKIYDLSGRLIFTGQYSNFDFSNYRVSSQILIIVSYDNLGNIINTSKKFFTK